jgi:hypothetical protein
VGSLEMLIYAHERGAPWYPTVCKLAAMHNHLECLRYAHEQGCGWDRYTCAAAAEHGHLRCLQYAHEQGCVWTVLTFPAETEADDSIGYMRCRGWGGKKLTCWTSLTSVHPDCMKYAKQQSWAKKYPQKNIVREPDTIIVLCANENTSK